MNVKPQRVFAKHQNNQTRFRDHSQTFCATYRKTDRKILRGDGSIPLLCQKNTESDFNFSKDNMPTNDFAQPFTGIISFLCFI